MLSLNNIVESFNLTGKPEDKITILNGLSLQVEDGEFVVIIGQNGSGKSTTMNVITGRYTPDSGSIVLNGKDITNEKEHQRAKHFGRVFQDPMMGTVAEMSVLENMEIAIRRGNKHSPFKWGFNKKNKDLFVNALKEFDLGLDTRLSAKAGTLSGGQRQALTLLMATLKKPEVLLLDEHTAALDPKTAKKVLALTDKIVRENKLTTLMVTHNMKDAITYGDRLIMFAGGEIVMDVKGEEKKKLTIEQLYQSFEKFN